MTRGVWGSDTKAFARPRAVQQLKLPLKVLEGGHLLERVTGESHFLNLFCLLQVAFFKFFVC